MNIFKAFGKAVNRMFYDDAFVHAGAMAFSLILAIFPFFMFLSTLAGFIGGSELVPTIKTELFHILPKEVATILEPQIGRTLSNQGIGSLLLNVTITIFIASSGFESLRQALNTAYCDDDHRSYLFLRVQSALIVIFTAAVMLFLAFTIGMTPLILEALPSNVRAMIPDIMISGMKEYMSALIGLGGLLYIFHIWLPAGKRSLLRVMPGIILTVFLWAISVTLFSIYLAYSQYDAIYAGFSKIMISMIFFYISSIIIILGAEFNSFLWQKETHDDDITA